MIASEPVNSSFDNLILIGMPAVGKTTIGHDLAEELGFGFMDTDDLIMEKEQKPLSRLISENGADGFLEIEARHVSALEIKNHVIATGGSVVYRQKAMDNLKRLGKVIHLDLDPVGLKNRLDDLGQRGVVLGNHTGNTVIELLYEERYPLYMKYADETVSCRGLLKGQVVRRILKRLGARKALSR